MRSIVQLVVVVVAVTRVMIHAQAKMVRHATEAQLAERRREFTPHAFDGNAVRVRIDARRRRHLRIVKERHRVVTAALHDLVTAGGWNAGRLIRVTGWRRAEHEVIEQIDLAQNAQVVGNVQLGVDAKTQIGSRIVLVLTRVLGEDCGAGIARHLVALARCAQGGPIRKAVAGRIPIVRRHRPERLIGPTQPAEREVMKHLGAGSEVAVQFENRSRVRPPIFGEHRIIALGFLFRGRSLRGTGAGRLRRWRKP